ncbi:MAG TPA: hypothetical protein VFY36_02800 [Solirubrobacteraceae bacterium]|nr:hypothetical protein [Solirubrobacteraceae bacterium]
MRRALALTVAVGVALSTAVVCATAASAAPSTATIAPSLSPNRLHAKGALKLTIRFAGGEFGVPSPVRKLLLKLPAELGVDIPNLRSCSAARLRARGARGCPARSKIGGGHALVQAHAGSQLITENIALWVFLGPLHNFQPTFEVLGRGYTPLQKQAVLSGTVVPDHAPYGEALALNVPPVPTLPLEPNASIAALTLTIGTSGHRLSRHSNTVVVPGSCPVGGFPFAAEFTYADGSTGSALATAPCPQ